MRRLTACSAALGLAIASVAAHSQSYPNRPVRMVNPFTPGGGVDVVARPIAQQLTEA